MPENSLDLTIIIISFNTKQITLNCLESIHRSLKDSNKLTYEVIVLDNASGDDSVNALTDYAKNHSDVRLVLNKENVGFARANNQAAKIAHGKNLLLLNSDTVVLDNGIEKMYEFYVQNKHVHFLGAKLFNKDMTPQASSAPFYTLPVVFGALFLKGDYWGLTRSSPNHTVKTDWVSGACIMTKMTYYDKINGFNEGIFMYMDEVDLLYRAKKIGLQTYFFPGAQFIHLGSASSNGKTYPILQVYQGFIFFYRAHYSHLSLIILKIMLQLKAVISIIIGYVTNNNYLKETYEKALKMAR